MSDHRRAAAKDGQEELAEACREFGPDTPAAIRRKAAAVLRNQGWALPEIGAVFGLTGPAISRSLRGDRPGPRTPGELAAGAIRELARAAGQARQALAAARERLGPDTTSAIWREDLGRLSSAGFSRAELTELFSGIRSTISRDLDVIHFPAGLPAAASLVTLVREHGPAALDAYAPSIDLPTGRETAAAWLGISPNTIAVYENRRRAGGSLAWPLPDSGDQWTYRTLVCHRAAAPGTGTMSPQGAARAARILAILASAARTGREQLSTAEIRDELGISPARNDQVLESLNRLARLGQVKKIKPGGGPPRRVYWRLPSTAR